MRGRGGRPERRAVRAAWRSGPHCPSSWSGEGCGGERCHDPEVEPDGRRGAGPGRRRAGVGARAAAHVRDSCGSSRSPSPSWSSSPRSVLDDPELVLPEPELPELVLDDGRGRRGIGGRARARVARRGRGGGRVGDQRAAGQEAGGQCADGQHVAKADLHGCGALSSREAPARSGRYTTRCTPDLSAGAERRGRVRGVT